VAVAVEVIAFPKLTSLLLSILARFSDSGCDCSGYDFAAEEFETEDVWLVSVSAVAVAMIWILNWKALARGRLAFLVGDSCNFCCAFVFRN
jgi:hypothetical protein